MPMLKLYRRHRKSCPHKTRNYRRCRCPIWAAGTANGKKVKRSLGTCVWDDAEMQLRTESSAVVVSLDEAIARFMDDAKSRGLSPDTLYKYNLLLSSMESLPKNLRSIKTDDLARFREAWKMSPISARKRLERLKAFFRFCRERGWIASNPAKPLKPPKGQPMPTLPFSEDECGRILDACSRFPNKGIYSFGSGERVRAFVLVLMGTGLRIRDAVTLEKRRIEGGKLRLWTQKTGSHVSIPLKPEVADAVMGLPGDTPFWSGNGLPKSAVADWQRTLGKLFKLAGVEGGHAHRFRDTMSVKLLTKGVPVETVAAILGNSPTVVLKHYAPWVLERQRALEEAVMKCW
jgi:integrase/recombinase XerD